MNITITTQQLAIAAALLLLAWNVLLTLYVRRDSIHLGELQGWTQRSMNRLQTSVRKIEARLRLAPPVVTQRISPDYDPQNPIPGAPAFERADGMCTFEGCPFAAVPGTERCADHISACTCGVDSGAAPGDHNPRCPKYDGAAPLTVKP